MTHAWNGLHNEVRMTRCLNPGGLTEGEMQSVSVVQKWKEHIWWYSADVHRRRIFLLVELSDLTDEAGRGPEKNYAFIKGVMNCWHKLPWEGGKVTLHNNWDWMNIFFSKQLDLYLKNSFKNLSLKQELFNLLLEINWLIYRVCIAVKIIISDHFLII